MIAIVSPTKNMQRAKEGVPPLTSPVHIEYSKPIVKELQKLNPFDIESLMKVNEKLAVQTFMDFQEFSFSKSGTPAVFTYDGLVFKNMQVNQMSEEELQYINTHIRILSGLYGVVRPMDGIQPYRLEMQCPVEIQGGNLYQYWGDTWYNALYQENDTIINLASKEYSKAVTKYLSKDRRWIDVEFLVDKGGKLKTLATYAKMARGQMIRFMAQNGIQNPEELKNFTWNEYEFVEELSSEKKYVFVMKD